MKGIYNSTTNTVREAANILSIEQPTVSYDHPEHSQLWAEYHERASNYLSSLRTYPASGFDVADGSEVEYELTEMNPRYEGISGFSGKIYHYDTVAIPVKQPNS